MRVEEVGPDRWEVWREIRLRSLAEDPDAFGSTYEREAEFDEETWRSRVDGTSGPAVLAFVHDVPVGMGGGFRHEPGSLTVVAMWTEPAWRGRGVGGRVLEHVVRWARTRRLATELWVADANLGARRLYERHGFRGDGRSEPLRQGSTISMSHLVLDISDAR